MPEPFLSHMNMDEHSPNVARVGRWEPNAYDLLQRIAGATPEKSIDLSELARSVPSVWGYAILFHSVWRDHRHMAHRQVVELWRRALALAVTRVAWQEQNVNFRLSRWFEMAEENQTFVGAAAYATRRDPPAHGSSGWTAVPAKQQSTAEPVWSGQL